MRVTADTVFAESSTLKTQCRCGWLYVHAVTVSVPCPVQVTLPSPEASAALGEPNSVKAENNPAPPSAAMATNPQNFLMFSPKLRVSRLYASRADVGVFTRPSTSPNRASFPEGTDPGNQSAG